MTLADLVKYLGSLHAGEVPPTGFIFVPNKDGTPAAGTFMPAKYVLSKSWAFCPTPALEEARNECESEFKPLELLSRSVTKLQDMYRLSRDKDSDDKVLADAAGVIYDIMSRRTDTQWKHLQPYERQEFMEYLKLDLDNATFDRHLDGGAIEKDLKLASYRISALDSIAIGKFLDRGIASIVHSFIGTSFFLDVPEAEAWTFTI